MQKSNPGYFLRAGLVIGALGLAACSPKFEGTSVLLISADSLRVDRLSAWNPADAPPTPNLDALTARGTLYKNTWASSPWTAPSMVSVMTGLYPPSHGIVYRDDTTSPALPTLPRLLAAEGYRLGNFSFFSEISYFRNLGLGPAEKGLTHKKVGASFRRWLGEVPADQAFFAWVHLLEPHLPYGASGYRATKVKIPGSSGLVQAQLDATVPYGEVTFEAGDRERLLKLYDRDVRSMDLMLGRVLKALEAKGRTANTLVIFVADHGEELLDGDWIGHASTAIRARLRPEILQVPLVLAGPGVTAGQVQEELVQQVDVLPTVLRLLGLERLPHSDGHALPGTAAASGFLGLGRPGTHELAFFDSSMGGNLTPQDRRGDRLQGVTDGEQCLLAIHTFQDRAEEVRTYELSSGGCNHPEAMREALEDWRRQQTSQRVEVLARHPAGNAPPSDEVDGYAEGIQILEPVAGAPLRWETTRGQIAMEWTGDGDSYWIEYHLSDLLETSGSFQIEQQRVVFGPVPQGFWNDLVSYSPFRFRLVDAVNEQRSAWVELELAPAS